MIEKEFDITIIGAGIHGAGVAQAAAAHGYSVLLIEQYDSPAQGTSSRSSKLIHGGLRYLANGEFKLVYECLRERQLLLRNAPELVKLKTFTIPIYKNSQHQSWKIMAGLMLYRLLAGFSKISRFYSIPKSNWNLLKGLNKQSLKKIYCYNDGQTNDAKLTQAVIRSAESLGCKIQYKTRFCKAIKMEEGYQVNYFSFTGQQSITTKSLVLATGPWINHSIQLVFPIPKHPEIELIQGTHILLPGSVKENRDIGEQIYYLQNKDGRAIFVIPWQGKIMLGTTEKIFQGDPADTLPSEEEINYLLEAFNYFFPNFYENKKAQQSDILERFSGLRVLPKSNKKASARTRETIFIKDNKKEPRLVSIYGGKLTSYRSTAEKVIKQLKKQLPKREKIADTKKIKLETIK